MSQVDWRLFLRDAPVVEVRSKKKKKAAGDGKRPKYSPGVLSLLGVAEQRLVGGLAEGAQEYLRLSRKAAAAGKDGAVRSAAKNLVRAQEKAVQHASKAPRDLVKGPDFRRSSKQARRITRLLAW